ncbi:hypothetical protein D3C78_1585420 [compost metagenome]
MRGPRAVVGQQGLGARHDIGDFTLEDQRARVAVLQDERQLLGREPVVDGVEHRAYARRGQQREHEGRRVVEKGRDHIPARNAQRQQAMRMAIDFGVELRIGPGAALAAVPGDQRFLVGQVTRGP